MEIFQASENFGEISLLKINICLYQWEKQKVISVFEVVKTSENLCMGYIIRIISTAEYMDRVWNKGDDKNKQLSLSLSEAYTNQQGEFKKISTANSLFN